MLKASCLAALAAVTLSGVADAFVAPVGAPRTAARAGRGLAMSGKAALDTLPRVVLTDDATGHSASVHLHGGCVTSYKAPHEVSARSSHVIFQSLR
jgi:hypothetical protein